MTGPRPTKLLEEEPNGPLYHYTSVVGLYGIIASQSLWASAVQYFNDALEFKHALQVARGHIYRREREAGPAVRSLMRSLSDQLERIEMFTVCAFSLSADGDLLSQWRAYCPPGGGYSIGFDRNELKRILAAQGCSLVRCVYDDREQLELIAEALDPFLRGLPTEFPTDEEELKQFRRPFENEMFSRLTPIAPLIKHPSFKEEKEWRAICAYPSTQGRIHHRQGRSMLIPYVPISIGSKQNPMPIDEIVVGPTPHFYLAASSLGGFLRENGQTCHRGIRTSNVPYREL